MHPFFLLTITVLVFILILRVVNFRIMPTFRTVAESKAQSVATLCVNTAVNELMKSGRYTYDALMDIRVGESGNVIAIQSNVATINQMKAELADEISKKIENLDVSESYIPFGNFLGSDIFSGIGPRIPVRIVPLGYSVINMKNSFESAGINQTKHEVYLDITVSVTALLPVSRAGASVSTMVPIAETIIVGEVPDNYTNVEGLDGSAQDATLDLID